MLRFALITALLAVTTLAQEVPVSISAQTPASATIGQPYNLQLMAAGGVPPYTWRLAEGSGPLPPGLQLDTQAGRISGTPTTPGSYSFRIAVTDSAGSPSTDIKPFVITVPEALILDWDDPPRATKDG